MSTSIDLLIKPGSNIDKKFFTVYSLKKAFDTIDHSNLMRKLELCGIRGLSSINGVDSELKEVGWCSSRLYTI